MVSTTVYVRDRDRSLRRGTHYVVCRLPSLVSAPRLGKSETRREKEMGMLPSCQDFKSVVSKFWFVVTSEGKVQDNFRGLGWRAPSSLALP